LADIAAADIAIRNGPRTCARPGWKEKPPSAPSRPTQGQNQVQEKEGDLDGKRGSQPRRCALNKVNPSKPGKTDYDIATKAVLDNMAKLKALRLAREAAEPPRPAATKKARHITRRSRKKSPPALSDWLAGQQAADAGLKTFWF